MPDNRRTEKPAPPVGGWTADAAAETKVRSVHVNELRTAIGSELSQRLSGYSFTYNSVSQFSNIRATHVNELREACEVANASTWCVTDATPDPTWSDGTRVTAGSTKVRIGHITELRNYMATLSSQCLCNCNGYCCNCDGYCSCNCNGHCNCQGHFSW